MANKQKKTYTVTRREPDVRFGKLDKIVSGFQRDVTSKTSEILTISFGFGTKLCVQKPNYDLFERSNFGHFHKARPFYLQKTFNDPLYSKTV